jgi:hypothetical protein
MADELTLALTRRRRPVYGAKRAMPPDDTSLTPYGKRYPETIGLAGEDLGGGPGGGGAGGIAKNPKKLARRAMFQNLLNIILSQGKTDPQLLNRELQGIQRSGEADVGSLEEAMGAQGYTSGVGSALALARKAATGEMMSDARAREAAMQEQRKREDLKLVLDLIINPRLQRRGQNYALMAAKAAGKGGGLNWASILGGLGQGVGSYYGSGGGKKKDGAKDGDGSGGGGSTYGSDNPWNYGDSSYYEQSGGQYGDSGEYWL